MSVIVFDRIFFTLTASELAPELRIDEGTEDFDSLVTLVEQATAVARPKAVYAEVAVTGRGDGFVELGGVRVESRTLAESLLGVQRVFPYVATCGTEVEEWSSSIADFLQNWWMDVAKAHILTRAIRHLNGHLRQDLMLGAIANRNPGALPDWPIAEQHRLFSLLGDVTAQVGVRLTESGVMLPIKSVSGIYFQSRADYEN